MFDSISLASHAKVIAAIRDPVIRNLQITECYADLAAAMRTRTGGWADWCTFATWASRQAGTTIRGEDLLTAFQRHLRARWIVAPLVSLKRALLRKGLFQPDTRLGRVVAEIHTPFDAFERASAEVALGNQKVFAEIGIAFARFLADVPEAAHENSMEFAAFVATLRPGPPPDGQDWLRKAFACYVRQGHEADALRRVRRGRFSGISWSACMNRRVCSRRSKRPSTLRSRRRRTSASACCTPCSRRRGGGRAGFIDRRHLWRAGWPAKSDAMRSP